MLVTGGAGFVGSHLCDAFLDRGDEVCVIDDLSCGRASRLPERVMLYRDTLLNASRLSALVAQVSPELICHLAAQVDVRASVACSGKDAEVNVVGTVNLLEAARDTDVRVLFASTGGALYGAVATIPSAESTVPIPGSPYGLAKYCAEQYINLYNRLYGSEHSILRFANVYGPRQEESVVSAFCANSVQGKPLTIYGDGKQTRDFVYVQDCVAAFLSAADHGRAGIWNIGTGTEVNVLDLAELVVRLTGNRSKLVFAPARVGEVSRSALIWERAARDLGWRPTTSLANGLFAVIRWLEAGAPDRALG